VQLNLAYWVIGYIKKKVKEKKKKTLVVPVLRVLNCANKSFRLLHIKAYLLSAVSFLIYGV